jgi:hypothetical protein
MFLLAKGGKSHCDLPPFVVPFAAFRVVKGGLLEKGGRKGSSVRGRIVMASGGRLLLSCLAFFMRNTLNVGNFSYFCKQKLRKECNLLEMSVG